MAKSRAPHQPLYVPEREHRPRLCQFVRYPEDEERDPVLCWHFHYCDNLARHRLVVKVGEHPLDLLVYYVCGTHRLKLRRDTSCPVLADKLIGQRT